MAVLVHEEALLPRRLKFGLVTPQALEREPGGRMLEHFVDHALRQAGARLRWDTGQRSQAQAEPSVALSMHAQHQLAEEIVHETVGHLATMPHEVDRGDTGLDAGNLVRRRHAPV